MNGKVITVSSMKGGVGKTEVSLNLAVGIRKKTGKKVVVLDFDIPYGGVSQALAIDKQVSLSDWIRTNRAISEESAKSLVIEHETGVDLVPAIASAYDLDRFTKVEAKRIIRQLATFYDYVIVDSGVDFSEITKTALLEADKVIIVTSPSNVSIWNNHQYKEDLVTLGLQPAKIVLFINQVQRKNSADISTEQVVETYENSGVSIGTVSIAYYDDAIRKSRNKREFIYLTKKNNSFSLAIDDMLSKIGVAMSNTTVESSSSGFLTFFKKVFAK